jgi:putative secretion ATPase (PEP-CTERM system associated)
MYEAFYGLTSKPFQLSPDPAFYFNSKQHRRAKAYLEYGVARSEGFIVVTGEIGAGKTTILSGLLNSLSNSNVNVGQLVTTQLDAEDTLRMVSAAFGVSAVGLPKAQLLITLEAYLIDQASQGKRCLLVVDEAQNLSPRAVEELRMLSNYQLGTQALLQSFLVGQPEFRRILQRPEMEQLRQRVAATCHIGPMDLEDTQHYIEHRLKCAGSRNGTPFAAEAMPLIFKASHGIPRRINALCDRLLLAGYLAGKTLIGANDVREVVSELAQEGAMGGAVNGNGEPTSGPIPLDGALSRMALEPAAADAISGHLGSLAALQQGDRLQRLERSVLRLEQLSIETLETLKKLVNAVRKPPASGDGGAS